MSLVSSVQKEIAVRLNEVSADEASVYLGWINLTTQDIGNSLTNTRYLEASAYDTTSAGTRLYDLPSDFSSMYSVIIPAHNVKLGYVPKQEFDALQPSATAQGIPTRYTIYKEDIEFYPTPNGSLDVYYSYNKALGSVSAGTSDIPVPEAYLELYVNKGVQYGLERRGDYQQALVMERRYEKLLQKMNEDIKSAESKRMKNSRDFRISKSGDPIVNQYIH